MAVAPAHVRRVVAVDWSGALKRQKRKIWVADLPIGSDTVRLTAGRTRDETVKRLIEIIDEAPHTVIGLDFAFSFPAWFLDHNCLEAAKDVWERVGTSGESWLAECPWPFWGRADRTAPTKDAPSLLRATEKLAGAPKSVFQLNYPGAVGTSSLRGMPYLLKLRAAGCSIWPFDELRLPAVVEIYPRLYTGPVNKTSSTIRKQVAEALGVQGDNLLAATESDDAFDALLSVREMKSRLEVDITSAGAVVGEPAAREGWIWSVPPASGSP